MNVHIIGICFDDFETGIEDLECYCPPERLTLLQKQKTDKGRKQALASGALLYMLQNWLTMEKEKLSEQEASGQFLTAQGGKPYYQFHDGTIYSGFNLTHFQNFVLLAYLPLSQGTVQLGIDGEVIREARMPVAKRFFAEREYQCILNETDVVKRNQLFYQIWTRKEAMVKCTGEGLRMLIRDIPVMDNDSIATYLETYGEQSFCYSLCGGKTVADTEKPAIIWIKPSMILSEISSGIPL